jgi:hypothetical protein
MPRFARSAAGHLRISLLSNYRQIELAIPRALGTGRILFLVLTLA